MFVFCVFCVVSQIWFGCDVFLVCCVLMKLYSCVVIKCQLVNIVCSVVCLCELACVIVCGFMCVWCCLLMNCLLLLFSM